MFNRFDKYNMRKVVRNLTLLAFISFTAGTVVLVTSNGGHLVAKNNNGNIINQIHEEIKDSVVNSTKETNENSIKKTDDNSINQVKEEKIEGVDEITIKSTSAQIIIIPEKRSNVKAELTGTSSYDNTKLETNLSGKELDIAVENQVTVGINLSFPNLKLCVYIPEDYSKALEVKSTSGKIEIGKMSLKELICKNTSGSVEISEITVDKFDYSNVSGSLKAETLNTKQSTVKAVSGSMKINNFNGNLEGSETSGSIDIGYKDFNNNIDLSAVSGSIRLKLPENSEFGLDARSTSGSINSKFGITVDGAQEKHKLAGYVKSKKNTIEIKTTSGSINIER